MDSKQLAIERFKNKFNCSQAVFSAYAESLGLDTETSLRIASGFGAGIAKTQRICGAVSGGIMALGLKYGSARDGEEEKKIRTYQLSKQLIEKFEKKYGSVECKCLLGFDMNTEEGLKKIMEKDLYRTLCPELVKDCIDFTGEILEENK